MIKYKGLQVAPAELEGLLLSHSSIQEVVIIRVPDVNIAGNELLRPYVVADQSKITHYADNNPGGVMDVTSLTIDVQQVLQIYHNSSCRHFLYPLTYIKLNNRWT